MTPQQFADTIAPNVITDCINTGVFPSVVIAQAMQESGYGSSYQAQHYKNIFGHTASASYSGPKKQTVPGGMFWRVYNSIADSISAHISILKKPVYRLAGAFKATTPFEQAAALQKAGYDAGADRDKYAQKLSSIIKKYGLQKYDQQLIGMERKKNDNNLAYSEQDGLTRTLHNIFNS
jgi:flagellum-specific peptidoglycan hydrolase FlgJ